MIFDTFRSLEIMPTGYIVFMTFEKLLIRLYLTNGDCV